MSVNGRSFVTGRLGGKDVVLLMSGIGHSQCDDGLADGARPLPPLGGGVSSGITGGVDPAPAIGDVVVPEQWAEYLEMPTSG